MTVQPDTPITQVVGEMSDNDVGSVIVLEDGEPSGVLTDRTIALALEGNQNIDDVTARDLVDGDLVTVNTEANVFDALQEISDAGIRRLPVLDEEGNLAGIVTLDDILVLLGSELNKATEVIRKQSPRF